MLQAHHCLTTWLQLWYHSLLRGDRIRKDADLEKQNCLFGVQHRGNGEIKFSLPLDKILPCQIEGFDMMLLKEFEGSQ